MCGRYTLFTPEQVLEIKSIVKDAEERLRARNSKNVRAQLTTEDIRPTSLAPVLFPHNGRLVPAPAFWGFTHNRARENRKREAEGKKPLKPKAAFNTRDDQAATNGFWRDSFHKRRCIIPAAAFEEWTKPPTPEPGEKKQKGVPYFFTMPENPVLYIAGIWHNELDENGEKWPHFSMITTDAGGGVEEVHDRMPLVILPVEFDRWTGEGYRELLDRAQLKLNKKLAQPA